MKNVNTMGQPIGWPVPDWTAAHQPTTKVLEGQYCRLERLTAKDHSDPLFQAFGADRDGNIWTYLPHGPFADAEAHRIWAASAADTSDPYFMAIRDLSTGAVTGHAALMRITPEAGTIEVGNINYAPALQRTKAATEAMYLLARHVFEDLGYRRYEWKCDALNAGSRKAAARLGFTFEGIFRQALVYKGRNRDTAWFSMLDSEWPQIKQGFERWLAQENFDQGGNQRTSLQTLANTLEAN